MLWDTPVIGTVDRLSKLVNISFSLTMNDFGSSLLMKKLSPQN